MAPTTDKDSAACQFAVFGKVVTGIEVADKIAQVPTKNEGSYQNALVKTIITLYRKPASSDRSG